MNLLLHKQFIFKCVGVKTVKEFMSKKVVKFSPDDSVFDVARAFAKRHISGAPVVDKGNVIGVISETDITKFMELESPTEDALMHEPHLISLMILGVVKNHIKFRKHLEKISKIKVKDLMNKKIVSISSVASISDAALMMDKNDVNRLPVIDDGRLVGVIARADLIKALIE